MIRVKQRWLEITAALVSFGVYAAFSNNMLIRQSGAPHFVYQAAGWLSGHLYVSEPPNLNDWVRWDNHWYVSFPPFPAVLMLPFVALNGLQLNDVFFTVCLAALNVGLFVGVLKSWRTAGKHARPDWQIALLAAFFGFGTLYFYSSIRGEVWFTAHVTGVTLTLLYLWAAVDARHPLMAGFVLGCAALTRANLAFAFPFFLIECFAPDEQRPLNSANLARGVWRTALFGIAGLVAFIPALWMNHERWGKWGEFGHSMLYHNRVNKLVEQYGLFSLHFLPGNFRSAFLMLPVIKTDPFNVTFDGNGMSMFVTTPLLVLVPFAFMRSRTSIALAMTAAIVALPGLLYMNNGWFQFGFRFSIDYMPYVFFLLAISRLRMNAIAIVLGILGVAVNTWGAIVFSR